MKSAKDAPPNVNAWYIDQTLQRAKDGNVDAAEEALSLFRGAVDARLIDGVSPEYRALAEHLAACLWRYESTGEAIADALGVQSKLGVGAPKGTRKVNEDSYAALLVLVKRQLGSASQAKSKVLELEANARNETPVSQRTLDSIYANYAPIRDWEHKDLVVMLTPAHRKLLAKILR